MANRTARIARPACNRPIRAMFAAAITMASCSSPDDATVLVLGASSLTEVMSEIEDEYEATNPGVDIDISFAGSDALRTQVEQGAPADVVAFADIGPMDDLVASGDVDAGDVIVFAENSIVLVTPSDDPGDVDDLSDLADPERTVGVCAPAVPCGQLAQTVLDVGGVDASIDTEEPDVRSLVAKLVSGELDAGLVYATDAAAFPDDLRVVPFAFDSEQIRERVGNEVNEYPIAVLADADRPAADRFVDFVRSDAGSMILTDAGFGLP